MRIISFMVAGLFAVPSFGQGYLPEKNNSKIKVKPAVDVSAYAFNLRDVRLLDGSPFKNAMDKDAAYLLTLEPDRLLHRFHANAGLPAKAQVYGGWESDGLSGHTLGHYLSACAMMYASTGDARFKEKVDYVISELDRCQKARKTGYVGAIPKEDSIFWKVQHGIIKTAGFDLNGGWSPWYTVHKVMAGLADAYLLCDNAQALTILTGMADWTGWILKDLNEDQLELMRKCEYGGMNDILVHTYELTGEKKYLDLSYKFHDQFVLGQLEKKIDALQGKHSNTNVPKAIGCARRHELTGSASDRTIANFFWDTIVGHYTYVIGGNSNYEYLGEPDKLNDRISDNTCETCNTYNMLKLTRFLYSWDPKASYADYYERALYNHILASQNPSDGMMCYFVPLRMGTKKHFSEPFNTFTCCVGSGIENHSKYTEGIYYEAKDGGLLVNLFIPSELNWRDKGVVIRQESKFPEDNRITFSFQAKKPSRLTLKVRQPKWAAKDLAIAVNGKPVKMNRDANGYWTIDRTWKDKDKLEVVTPMNLYSESMPDNPNRIALLYGPVVMAGQLGNEMPDPIFGTTVLLTDNHNINEWAKPTGAPLTFQTDVSKPSSVTLIPFYKTVDQYYNVYWDYFTTDQWQKREGDYQAQRKYEADIAERTIDIMRLGEMQPERDHNLKASEKSYTSDAFGRNGREARNGGFFSFDMTVLADTPSSLLCSYIGDDQNRSFDLLVDGVKIGTQELKGSATGRFFDVTYPIPNELLKGKSKVEVKIQGHPGKTAGRVFGCRIIRN
ncbi:MAG: glycoside hydrolase family 127 protein [Cyclobacteriaceae bacterium]|nr:glycoside hydrolase family 127 protein [Cyclobacteriaceae bacterium]